jgi:uncharacterized damage-inducible protein DinB
VKFLKPAAAQATPTRVPHPGAVSSLFASYEKIVKIGQRSAIGTNMNLPQYFSRQFAYDAWANGEVLSAIKTASASQQSNLARPLKLLAHILSAEQLWLERLSQQPQTMPVWPDSGIAQCEAQIPDVARTWREFLSGISDSRLMQKVNYKNSKGELWGSIVQDVLTHVLLHSAYHRGQIASALRESGAIPAYTDFIHAVRQGFIE